MHGHSRMGRGRGGGVSIMFGNSGAEEAGNQKGLWGKGAAHVKGGEYCGSEATGRHDNETLRGSSREVRGGVVR